MKILCVIPSYWPAFQFGGPIFSVHALNKALVRKGIDVTVYTTNVGLNGKVPVNQEVNVDGVKVTYFAFARFFEFLGATGWQLSLPMTVALKKNLKTFDIIYIVAMWNYPVTVAAYYSRKFKLPHIISPRGHLYPYVTAKKFWKKWPYYYLITKRDLNGATAIHYTTQDEAEKCHLSLGLKNMAYIIPNGIDLSEFKDLPEKRKLMQRQPVLKNKKVILFLGRINWKKGLDILLRAYSLLIQMRDDLHLLIVGNDEAGYSKKVKRWVAELGLENSVTFTGMLLGKEKLEVYANSDIFVFPSYSENFGMSVIEAMASELPVVISNKVGICREIKESKAGIVVDTNVDSLYNGINSLLNDPVLRTEIITNGSRLVQERYDINKVADATIKVYKEILKNY